MLTLVTFYYIKIKSIKIRSAKQFQDRLSNLIDESRAISENNSHKRTDFIQSLESIEVMFCRRNFLTLHEKRTKKNPTSSHWKSRMWGKILTWIFTYFERVCTFSEFQGKSPPILKLECENPMKMPTQETSWCRCCGRIEKEMNEPTEFRLMSYMWICRWARTLSMCIERLQWNSTDVLNEYLTYSSG